MTQEDGIYNRTIEDNIFLGSKKQEDINKYIRNFAMEDLMEQNAGLQGTNLSGGQIRRITFLRMINGYRLGMLLIFDEPFVALDKKLMEKIKSFILSQSSHSIVVVVDHMDVFTNHEAIYINL